MVKWDLESTIVAIASGTAPAQRGIVRLTGPDTVRVVGSLFVPFDTTISIADSRRISRWNGEVKLTSPLDRCDAALMLWPTHRSYTGQPSAEIHCIGSMPILESIVDMAQQQGAKIAQPGEFTLRAFLAGRIDLTQAEGVLGVINAQNTLQLTTALEQLAGGLSAPLRSIRSELLEVLAHLEAGLDFVDEDIEFITNSQLTAQLDTALQNVLKVIEQVGKRHTTNDRPRIVLLGDPNTGKSSLINALAGHDVAIVSPTAGTTRDYLSAPLKLDDIDIELIDTAGLDRSLSANIDQLAQSSAIEQSHRSELTIWCIDLTKLTESVIAKIPDILGGELLVVGTKLDEATPLQLRLAAEQFPGINLTSARTKEGLASLRATIGEQIKRLQSHEGMGAVSTTAARCRESLLGCQRALEEALQVSRLRAGNEELIAAEIRLALDELGSVAGEVYTDDLLDQIFSRFCIGK